MDWGNSELLVRYANRHVVYFVDVARCPSHGRTSKAQDFEQSPVVDKDQYGNLSIAEEGVVRNY